MATVKRKLDYLCMMYYHKVLVVADEQHTCACLDFDGAQESLSMLKVHHLTTQLVFNHVDQRQLRHDTLSDNTPTRFIILSAKV